MNPPKESSSKMKVMSTLRKMRTHSITLVLLSGVGLLAGCNQDLSDLERYIEQVRERPAAPIEPIPAIKPYVRFIYPGHELDPFDLSGVSDEKEQAGVPSVLIDESRMPEFLERFSLESLRMVGTVDKNNQLWALIQIPDGAVHRVRKGNYLGTNRGRIVNIEEAKIELQEVVDNGFGGYKEQQNFVVLFDPNKKG